MAKGYKQPTSPRGGGMMSQITKLQEQMAQAQEELAESTITETVGGGAVSITMSGDQNCRAVTIDPDLLADADVEMLQDLILSAINKALDSARNLSEEKMAPFTSMLGGLGLGR